MSKLELLVAAAEYVEGNGNGLSNDHCYTNENNEELETIDFEELEVETTTLYDETRVSPQMNQQRLVGRNRMEKSKHTEIEKKRRAYLRECLDRLKMVVPLDRASHRFTIQRLLSKSQQYIKTLKRRHVEYTKQYEHIRAKHVQLKRRLAELENGTANETSQQLADHQQHDNTSQDLLTTPTANTLVNKADDGRVGRGGPVTAGNNEVITTVTPGPHNRFTIQIQKIITKPKTLPLSSPHVPIFPNGCIPIKSLNSVCSASK